MQRFRIKKNNDKNLTIVVFYGKVSISDVMDAMNAFYQSEVTSKLICILSRCDLSALTKEDLSLFANKASKFNHLRTGGKSAYVCRDDLSFGLVRMFTTMTEFENNPNNSRAFRSAAEAFKWLDA